MVLAPILLLPPVVCDRALTYKKTEVGLDSVHSVSTDADFSIPQFPEACCGLRDTCGLVGRWDEAVCVMSQLYGVLENPARWGWSRLGAGARSQGVVLMEKVEEASLKALRAAPQGTAGGTARAKWSALDRFEGGGSRLRRQELKSQLTGGAAT